MNNAYPPEMARSLFRHPPNAARLDSRGFSILEVLVAASIAASVISLVASALLRQAALGEQTNRLTAVEGVVSADLDWFSNYARLWKLKTGSYNVNTDITKTTSPYTVGAAAVYEPSAADCTSGLAAALLADGVTMSSYSASTRDLLKTYVPPYEIKVGDDVVIPVVIGGVNGLNVVRRVDAEGSKIKVFYSLSGVNSNGLNFSREASLLVEAAAWCDRVS